MSPLNPNTSLIIEPKPELAAPYTLLPQEIQSIHISSTERAIQYLRDKKPNLVLISASYSPPQVFHLLEILKEQSSFRLYLIPIIFVVDLDHKINFVPGTFWGKKMGIINSLSTKKEIQLVVSRVSKEQKTLGFK